jgi:hypothetical protein
MGVAITFRDQAKHERCSNEHCYSSLGRREAESLPHFIEFETLAFFNHECLCGVFASTRAAPRRTLARRRMISQLAFYRRGSSPSRIDASFQLLDFPWRDFESESQEGGTRCPQRVELGPLPSASGQADPPLDFPYSWVT